MKKLCLKLIDFYRKKISPCKKRSSCRFLPTCSDYSYQAIEKYGLLKGGLLSIGRICRCNPFCKGGYDPLK